MGKRFNYRPGRGKRQTKPKNGTWADRQRPFWTDHRGHPVRPLSRAGETS